MGSRSPLFKTLVVFILLAIVLLQVLSMVQSDRLYARLNEIERTVKDGGFQRTAQNTTENQEFDEGDWLIWGLGAEPATLNPIHASGGMGTNYIVSGNIFESLLERDPDTLELKPFIAESFTVSDDGLEIYFKLKDNAYFSDGEPITAEDVLFTFQTIINPKVDAANLANYYQDVKEVQVISPLEVKFVMSKKYFKSLEITGGMSILPKHVYEFDDALEFNKRISDPVGSGPYVFEKWDTGNQVILKRNENYWDKKPYIKKIVYKIITNDSAALQSLKAGEIDFLRPLPDQYTAMANNEEFVKRFYPLSYWTPGAGYFYIAWNQERPFFKDKMVRRALTMLIDRETICSRLLNSPDAKVPTGPFYINGDQADHSIKPWAFDIQKAKELLTQAGWKDTNGNGIIDKDGVEFSFKYMIVGGSSLHENIGKLIKDSMAKAGIDVSIDPYEWTIFIQRLQAREFDATNLAWGGGLDSDPYQIWHSSQIGRGSNYVGFDEADDLIEHARSIMDRDKRNELYKEFHRIIHDQQPYTFVYTRPEQRFLSRRFKNVKVHKLGLDHFEWYVPKDEQRYK